MSPTAKENKHVGSTVGRKHSLTVHHHLTISTGILAFLYISNSFKVYIILGSSSKHLPFLETSSCPEGESNHVHSSLA